MATAAGRPKAIYWQQVGILIGLMVAVLWLWTTWVVYPLKILVVFFHELSHGLTAILTGGSMDHIEVVKEQGGLCFTHGGNRFLIISAGYLGSLLWGGIALLAAGRSRHDRKITLLFGGIVFLATLFWVRPLWSFGFYFHLATGVTLLTAGILLPSAVHDVILKVFGLTSCLYVIADIFSDTIAHSHLRSDARLLAEMTHVPTMIWGGVWIAIAVVFSFLFLTASCRRTPP